MDQPTIPTAHEHVLDNSNAHFRPGCNITNLQTDTPAQTLSHTSNTQDRHCLFVEGTGANVHASNPLTEAYGHTDDVGIVIGGVDRCGKAVSVRGACDAVCVMGSHVCANASAAGLDVEKIGSVLDAKNAVIGECIASNNSGVCIGGVSLGGESIFPGVSQNQLAGGIILSSNMPPPIVRSAYSLVSVSTGIEETNTVATSSTYEDAHKDVRSQSKSVCVRIRDTANSFGAGGDVQMHTYGTTSIDSLEVNDAANGDKSWAGLLVHYIALLLTFVAMISLWGIVDVSVVLAVLYWGFNKMFYYGVVLGSSLACMTLLQMLKSADFNFPLDGALSFLFSFLGAAGGWGFVDAAVMMASPAGSINRLLSYAVLMMISVILVTLHVSILDPSFKHDLKQLF